MHPRYPACVTLPEARPAPTTSRRAQQGGGACPAKCAAGRGGPPCISPAGRPRGHANQTCGFPANTGRLSLPQLRRAGLHRAMEQRHPLLHRTTGWRKVGWCCVVRLCKALRCGGTVGCSTTVGQRCAGRHRLATEWPLKAVEGGRLAQRQGHSLLLQRSGTRPGSLVQTAYLILDEGPLDDICSSGPLAVVAAEEVLAKISQVRRVVLRQGGRIEA
mmetsp:Transcript_65606/g.211672  ORF Transcript_65606/g.211672 Transcript_65606/m.211672 type:complete len:217 (-) Transcript_65606:782-1432(-)